MTEAGERGPEASGVQARAVLFADIVDSTKLYDERGDTAARRLLLQCLELMETVVRESKGVVHDRIGDELLCLFDDPDEAAHGAAQLQQRIMDAHGMGELETPMRLRIGFEYGDVIHTEEGLFGTTVHTAARLSALAKSGQILTTKSTLERLSALRQRMARYFDSVVLKGIASEQEIHEVLWDTSVTMVPTGRPRRRRQTGVKSVELTYGEAKIRVDATKPLVTLGRDAACMVRLDGSSVSRLHARISWNKGKVRVEDVSTNGTCVEPVGEERALLHHEGTEITGCGLIRCGCVGAESEVALVEFRCETESESDSDCK